MAKKLIWRGPSIDSGSPTMRRLLQRLQASRSEALALSFLMLAVSFAHAASRLSRDSPVESAWVSKDEILLPWLLTVA